MNKVIETEDQYFRISALIAANRSPINQPICIVDLESFSTIGELLKCIEKYDGSFGFLFVGGKGLLSGVMEKLTTVNKTNSMGEFFVKIRKKNLVPYRRVVSFLSAIKELSMLTPKEKKSVYGALVKNNLMAAAGFVGVTPRLYYQRMVTVARKLNLKSSNHVQFFINAEFSVEDIRNIIYRN